MVKGYKRWSKIVWQKKFVNKNKGRKLKKGKVKG